jgi:hypothetical protein
MASILVYLYRLRGVLSLNLDLDTPVLVHTGTLALTVLIIDYRESYLQCMSVWPGSETYGGQSVG